MTEIVAGFFDLPSVRSVIEHAVEELLEAKSVVVLLPNTAPAQAVRDRIAAELERRRFDDVDRLDTAAAEGVPEALLCAAFCDNASGLMPHDRLARLQKSARNHYSSGRDHELPGVLFLDRLDETTVAVQDGWTTFLERWQEATRANRNVDHTPCRFCVVGDASRFKTIPREDVFLTVVHWWGVPSELEMELLCRALSPSEGNRITLEERWRSNLLPVLAGGDPGLLEEMCARLPTTVKSIRDVLSGHCSRQRWLDYPHKGFCREVTNLIPTFADESSIVPPHAAMNLWAAGLLIKSPERGVHVHPAYLCSDDGKWLDFFDWQAKQRAYFGLMEQGRFALCRQITEALGKGWAFAVAPDDPFEQQRLQRSDMNCGWGHLGRILRQPQLASFQNWIGPSAQGMELRNRLAHAEAAPLEDVRTYQKELVKTLNVPAMRKGK